MSAQGRLLAEYQMLVKQTTPSIFARPNEADITQWTGIILGPAKSPYARGMFHFDMRFPKDYPNNPPRVLITTTSAGSVRFNPNLYNSGKVCLSILGTWRAESPGEQWSAVQNIQSILLSIQSLMHDKPFHNEPSFEVDDGSGDVERYNEKIAHESLRVAVIEVMEDTFANRPSMNGAVSSFSDLRKQLFTMQAGNYAEAIDQWSSSANSCVSDGRSFKMMPFEAGSNGMRGTFQWKQLRDRLARVVDKVEAEVFEWRAEGTRQAELLKNNSAIGRAPAVSSLREQLEGLAAVPVENCSVGESAGNPLVWEASLLGPEGTHWEGGFFQLEIIFPPAFPDLSPRVRFVSHMFHPNISTSGVPYLASLLLWHGISPRQRGVRSLLEDLCRFFVNHPDPEPITHLNTEAAELCFSADEARRKDYSRRVRRCAQRSNEE